MSTVQTVTEAERKATEVVDEIVKVISQDNLVKTSVQFTDPTNYSIIDSELARSSTDNISRQELSGQQVDIKSQG